MSTGSRAINKTFFEHGKTYLNEYHFEECPSINYEEHVINEIDPWG